MSDGRLGLFLPDGARLFGYADGYACGWTFAQANVADKFDTPEAARMAWEMSDKPPLDAFSRIRMAKDWVINHETMTRTSLEQNLIITEEMYEDAMS